MLSYHEHRLRRIEAASSYSGWDRPPYPFPHKLIGRVHMGKKPLRCGSYILDPGLHPIIAEVEDQFKAQEKRQNRVQFAGIT